MKVTRDKMENSQAYLTVEMEPAEVESSMEEAYRQLVKRTVVPGFRKGKAPRLMLERHLGRERLYDEALSLLLPRAYEDAIREQELADYARPEIDITQKEPLIFKATVPLPPKITLGDYKAIRMVPEPVSVTEESVGAVLERLRHDHATWEPVERPAAFHDLVTFNIQSTVEGKPFINQKGVEYQLLENYPAPLPGFADKLVGMVRDEVKDFLLPIPQDFSRPEFAGKEANIKIVLNEIKQEHLPELNDDFAKSLGDKFESLEALRKQITENLRLRAEEQARADFESKVIDALVAGSTVEFPPFLVERETNRLLERQAEQAQEYGGLEAYLANIKKTVDELREEMRPIAAKRVTRSLVLQKLSEEEKVSANDEEVTAEIEDMVKGAAEDKKAELRRLFNTTESRESIRQVLVRQKTVKLLTGMAQGSEATGKT